MDLHAGMTGVFVRLGAIALDEQLVVPIRLDVQVELARESNHLHGQVVRNSVIEDHIAIQRPDLSALVADDRSFEVELEHPRQRAWKRPAGARDHVDARRDDLRQRFDIARVEVQARVDDRAVEVEGQKSIPGRDRYRLTSGLSRFGGRPPRTAVAMLRAAIADISERVRTVALAMCGARTTLGSGISPGWIAGSRS